MVPLKVSDVKVEDILELVEAGHDDRPRLTHGMFITVGISEGSLNSVKLPTPHTASFP